MFFDIHLRVKKTLIDNYQHKKFIVNKFSFIVICKVKRNFESDYEIKNYL